MGDRSAAGHRYRAGTAACAHGDGDPGAERGGGRVALPRPESGMGRALSCEPGFPVRRAPAARAAPGVAETRCGDSRASRARVLRDAREIKYPDEGVTG